MPSCHASAAASVSRPPSGRVGTGSELVHAPIPQHRGEDSMPIRAYSERSVAFDASTSIQAHVAENESGFVMGGPNGTVMKIYGELQELHAAQKNLERRLHEWMGSEQEILQSIQQELKSVHNYTQARGPSTQTLALCNHASLGRVMEAPSKVSAPLPKTFNLRATAKVQPPCPEAKHHMDDTASPTLTGCESPCSKVPEHPPAEKGTVVLPVCSESIGKLQHVVKHLSTARPPNNYLLGLVRTMCFDNFWAAVIALNAVFIGIHVEYKSSAGTSHDSHFEIVGRIFTSLFLTELLLRIGAWRLQFFFAREDRWWNWFDFVLVLFSATELLLEFFFVVSGVGSASQGRLFRLLKMQKLMRLVRVLRFSQRLRVMIFMIFESAKNLAWLLVLVGCILYTVSICFAEGALEYLQSDDREHLPYFNEIDRRWGSLMRCIYSLYISMSNGIGWGELAEPLFHVSPFLGAVFLLWVSFGILALMNIVTGVFVDGALQKAAGERDMLVEQELIGKRKVIENLREIFSEADKDESGTLSPEEFCLKFEDERVQAYLHALGIHYGDSNALYKSLDVNGDGVLNIDEFILKLVDLKGSASATDIKFLIQQNRQMLRATHGLCDWIAALAPALHAAAVAPKADPSRRGADMDEAFRVDSTEGKLLPQLRPGKLRL